MPDSPSLPAIRERAREWQAQSDAIPGAAWPDRLVRVMLADLEVVLALVARLQGERDGLEKALVGLCVVRADGRSCWCEEEWLLRHAAEGHTEACRAARAALGEAE